MKSMFKLDDPDAADATMTTTMTIGQWRVVRDQITEGKYLHTSACFRDMISDLIKKAEARFYTTEE
jgi:hypothetical protein